LIFCFSPLIGMPILFLPLLLWSLFEYFSFYYGESQKDNRKKYKKYWSYKYLSPKNPSYQFYLLQIAWAALMMIPVC